jgi:mannosyltransferase
VAAFDRRDVLAAVTLGFAGLAASAAGSANASLWGDEAASILSAERPLPSLFTMVQNVDAVHGLYYLGLHFWIHLFGASPFSVRFPSAIAVGIAVGGVVLLGSRLRGLRFGIIGGIVGAVLPRMTDVGSEARSYAATAAIATWLSLIFVLQFDSPSPRRRLWVAYGALLALGTSLFIWVALVAAAHLVVLLVARDGVRARPSRIAGWGAATAAALLIATPVLTFAYLERDQISYLERRQLYDVTSMLVTPWFENPAVAIIAWLLIVAAIATAIFTPGRADGLVSARALLPIVWMLVPTVFLLAFSAFIAVYTPRYLAMCAPAVALLMATPIDVLAASRRRAEAAVALAFVLALVAPVWLTQRGPNAKNNSDWAQISATLGARAKPGDAVAFDDSVRPSRRTRLALRTYPAGFTGLEDPTLEIPFWENDTWYDRTYTLAKANSLGRLDEVSRIWLVEYAIAGKADTDGTATLLDAGFHLAATIPGHRSLILEYVRS